MIQRQLKLKLTKKQEVRLIDWLNILTGVWNFAIKKIEHDAKDGVYYTKKGFQNILSNHGEKIGVPSHTIQGMLSQAYVAWQRCFKKMAKKPRLKGRRNKLNSIPFPDPLREPKNNKISIPGIGKTRYHKQALPCGKIKCGRIIKRASGWYLCLFIDAAPNEIPITGNEQVGIDPGFKSLLTLSTGEKIEHPREFEQSAKRLAQAQRGKRKKLTARLQERIANRRKDRNHKLSRRLVSENKLIAFSADQHKNIAKKFGKSVTSSSHYQLRQMLSYKSALCGREYVEVDSRFTTQTCSVCLERTGPRGWNGLSVRIWECAACGAVLDRDVNSAQVILKAGLGSSLERKPANG
jgi:IS605 OrfB family transposase